MIIVVDAHNGVPIYRQLMDQIRFHIASGLLKPGDEIPSTRSLSAQLGVNPMTISKAFSLLEEQGVLERRPGLPLVVRGSRTERVRLDRLEQLGAALVPIVTMVRQLGISDKRAVTLLRKLLEDTKR